MNVFAELKQRKVLQTAALYFAIAWGATEVLSFLVDRIPVFPAWINTAIAILFVLGFPVAVFLAWMFDVDSDGVRRADPASGLGKGVIATSVVALLVVTGALSYLLLPRIEAERGYTGTGDIATVAVLPFQNMTGDPSLGYLGVGLAEDIRQHIASRTPLNVIGRVSMSGFASGAKDLSTIRGLLDAGLVLDGAVQRIGGALNVAVSLVDTTTGKDIWNQQFNTGEGEWELLRHRIVEAMAEQLKLTVAARTQSADVSEEALQAYLEGLANLHDPDIADAFLDEAIRLAPDFADAYARKAFLRFDMIWLGLQNHVAWEEAQPLIARAKEIDPDNLMADIALGHLQWWAQHDAIGAEETFRQAENRAPNHPLVLAGLGTAMRYMAFKEDEALVYHRRYLALDPMNPDAHLRIAKTLAFAHRMDEAMAHLDRALEIDPNFTRSLDYIANVEAYEGHVADALVTLTRKGQIEGTPSDETLSCMADYAAMALPPERAIDYLERSLARMTGPKDDILSWCWEPNRQLPVILAEGTDRFEEAMALAEAEGAEAVGQVADIIAHRQGDAQARYELLMSQLPPDGLSEFPPVTQMNWWFFTYAARVLLDAGHTDEARRVAEYGLPFIKQMVGPDAHFGAGLLVELLVVLGEHDEALELMERHRERFVLPMFYALQQGRLVPELANEPQFMALLESLEERRDAETAEIDRLTAAGEIFVP